MEKNKKKNMIRKKKENIESVKDIKIIKYKKHISFKKFYNDNLILKEDWKKSIYLKIKRCYSKYQLIEILNELNKEENYIDKLIILNYFNCFFLVDLFKKKRVNLKKLVLCNKIMINSINDQNFINNYNIFTKNIVKNICNLLIIHLKKFYMIDYTKNQSNNVFN